MTSSPDFRITQNCIEPDIDLGAPSSRAALHCIADVLPGHTETHAGNKAVFADMKINGCLNPMRGNRDAVLGVSLKGPRSAKSTDNDVLRGPLTTQGIEAKRRARALHALPWRPSISA